MRRSLLFIPGNNPAMLQNADVFESDAIIIDLEDAVSISEKDSARDLVRFYLKSTAENDLEIVIRINGLDSKYGLADLKAVVSDKIDTIMLPKAHAQDVKHLVEILSGLEKERGMKKKIGIIPIIELATSVLETEEIAKQARVSGLLLGAEDLTTDLGIERTKTGSEILFPRFQVIYACAANKIEAIDTPFTDTKDESGLSADCKTAAELGMNAKACIHPNQVETVNKYFSPSQKLIDWSLRVIEAQKKAEANGLGVFSLDGKMIDKPIIERAEKVLAKAAKFKIL